VIEPTCVGVVRNFQTAQHKKLRKKKGKKKVWRSTRERTCMIESRQRARDEEQFCWQVVVMEVDVIYAWIIR